jgi:hypothetical protein
MVGVDVGKRCAIDHRQGRVAEPDVFAGERAGLLGDDVAEHVPDKMRRGGGGGGGFDSELLEPVIGPGRPQCRANSQRLDAPGIVDRVIIGCRASSAESANADREWLGQITARCVRNKMVVNKYWQSITGNLGKKTWAEGRAPVKTGLEMPAPPKTFELSRQRNDFCLF